MERVWMGFGSWDRSSWLMDGNTLRQNMADFFFALWLLDFHTRLIGDVWSMFENVFWSCNFIAENTRRKRSNVEGPVPGWISKFRNKLNTISCAELDEICMFVYFDLWHDKISGGSRRENKNLREARGRMEVKSHVDNTDWNDLVTSGQQTSRHTSQRHPEITTRFRIDAPEQTKLQLQPWVWWNISKPSSDLCKLLAHTSEARKYSA